MLSVVWPETGRVYDIEVSCVNGFGLFWDRVNASHGDRHALLHFGVLGDRLTIQNFRGFAISQFRNFAISDLGFVFRGRVELGGCPRLLVSRAPQLRTLGCWARGTRRCPFVSTSRFGVAKVTTPHTYYGSLRKSPTTVPSTKFSLILETQSLISEAVNVPPQSPRTLLASSRTSSTVML